MAARWNVASGDWWGAVVQTVDSRYLLCRNCVEIVKKLCRNWKLCRKCRPEVQTSDSASSRPPPKLDTEDSRIKKGWRVLTAGAGAGAG